MTFDASRLARIDSHFRGYVDDGRLAGWQLTVGQHDELVHASAYGLADIEASRPVADDTLWRIYSMSKPVVSVAAMQLWEQGLFELTDPISRWIPSFESLQVFAAGSNTTPQTVAATEPIRMWHLLTHTSGLTYGFMQLHPVDAIYRAAGMDFGYPKGMDLAQACDLLATMPLKAQPGTAWSYGVSTDVLGRVLEVISGKPLDELLLDQLLGPLGMTDTQWWVPEDEQDRLAQLYVTGKLLPYPPLGNTALRKPAVLNGGGGLISTAADYWRFCRMLQRGGELDGVRIIAPRTLDIMAANHLPGGQDLAAVNTGGFAETIFDGVGFGLGFATVLDPAPGKTAASAGELYWGGLASTAFWVDRATGVTAAFYTQLVPSSTYPIRSQLRQLVYAALLD